MNQKKFSIRSQSVDITGFRRKKSYLGRNNKGPDKNDKNDKKKRKRINSVSKTNKRKKINKMKVPKLNLKILPNFIQ